jgi:hypothetical protein
MQPRYTYPKLYDRRTPAQRGAKNAILLRPLIGRERETGTCIGQKTQEPGVHEKRAGAGCMHDKLQVCFSESAASAHRAGKNAGTFFLGDATNSKNR